MDYRDQLKNTGKAIEPRGWSFPFVCVIVSVAMGLLLYRGLRKEAPQAKPPQAPAQEPRPGPAGRARPELESCPPKDAPGLVYSGRLLFDGRPIGETTQEPPRFWFRNEETGREASEVASCFETGAFAFWKLQPGRYLVSVHLNAERGNGGSYPGDYETSQPFAMPLPPDRKRDIDLMKVIHLLAPQDNGVGMEGWAEPCEKQWKVRSPVTFRWEPFGPGVEYRYTLDRRDERVTTAPSATLDVEPGCHEFRLFALRGGRRIGQLLTHGPTGGLGWSYAFRVE